MTETTETTEPLSIRIVRAVHQVKPRWLSSKAVTEAFADDPGSLVYANLSNHSKDEKKGPLLKRRGDGGVLEYTTIDGFDLNAWIISKTTPRRRAALDGDSLDVCVTIVQTLRQYKHRLTADELESTGRFKDRREMLLNIKQLCDEGEPLIRDRRANAAEGAPFEYGFKPDYDVDEWLRDRGASTDPNALGDAPALGNKPAPAAQAPGKPAAADPKPAAAPPASPAAAPPAPAAKTGTPPQSTSTPDTPAGARVVRGRDMRDDAPAKPQPATPPEAPATQTAAPKAPAAPAPVAPAAPAAARVPPTAPATPAAAAAASPKAQAIPSRERPHATHDDLATELVIISAACLATAVRAHVAGIDRCPELERALLNFELADRALLRARREKQPQPQERVA